MQEILTPLLIHIDPELSVSWVESAEAAFDLLEDARDRSERKPFCLILTDIFLTGKMTGIDLWKVCRVVYPTMPVLVMSTLPFGKFMDFRKERVQPIYLQKPINPTRCDRLLRLVLDGQVEASTLEPGEFHANPRPSH